MSSDDEGDYFNTECRELAKELPFSGTPDDNVEDFLTEFTGKCLCRAWRPAQKMRALFQCLKGEAADWFRENHLNTTLRKCIDGVRKEMDANGIVTPPFSRQEWKDFVASFVGRFHRKRNNCSTAHPYFSSRKSPDESWGHYAFTVGLAIDSLSRQSELSPPPLDFKIAMTIEKMSEDIRNRLELKAAVDWDDFLRLVEYAEDQIEAFERQMKSFQNYLRRKGKGRKNQNKRQ